VCQNLAIVSVGNISKVDLTSLARLRTRSEKAYSLISRAIAAGSRKLVILSIDRDVGVSGGWV
jgi:hypothetical protein